MDTGERYSNLDSLVVDITVAFAPEILADRIIPLSRSKSPNGNRKEDDAGSEQEENDEQGKSDGPVAGNFWIRKATAEQVGEDRVRLAVSAIAWRRVEHETAVVGAQFEVDEHLRIRVDMAAAGDVSVQYDDERRVVTLGFAPIGGRRRQAGDVPLHRLRQRRYARSDHRVPLAHPQGGWRHPSLREQRSLVYQRRRFAKAWPEPDLR